MAGFIRATSYARIAILCQCVVIPGHPWPQLSSAPFVSDAATRRLGALPTTAGWATRLAYARARRGAVGLESVLKTTGLTNQQMKDRGARLSVRQQIEFLNLASKALRDDFLGFHLGQLPDLRELGMLFYVAASSETLRDALQRAARYSSIGNEGLSMKYLEDGDIRIAFAYTGVARHTDRHQIEFFMTVLIRLCRRLTGVRLVPTRVALTHRRGNQGGSELAAYFGCQMTFGAKADDVRFVGSAKDIAITSADPYLNELLVASCERALSHRPKNRGTLRSAVQNAIVPLLPHGNVRASLIAARLGLSQRTLARRLAVEDSTFSEVLESLRGDLATQYLSEPDLSISRIAWLLGYQEVSAFTHAFKRWTGRTPREAHARHARHTTRLVNAARA
jgi:AraC-like DNA-binding protein